MQMKRGSILAETVLVMPLLLLLIFGVIQFAFIWTARQMTAYAAFCATRAIMVVTPDEQRDAAQDAAAVALSWMCMADKRESPVSIPGWGGIPGSGSARRFSEGGRVETTILGGCNGVDSPIAGVEVRFRYPLLIPGMAVNKVIANSVNASVLGGNPDFYQNLNTAAGNPNTDIDGFWPWIELSEKCVLPMPYSTEKFPARGFEGTDIRGGGS